MAMTIPNVPKNLKRIWLNNTGIFEIISNPGGGNCLFYVIAQALGHPEEHQRIREAVVNHLTRKSFKSLKLWKSMRSSILDFWKYSHRHEKVFERTLEALSSELEDKEGSTSTCCGIRKPRKFSDAFKKMYCQMMSQPGEPGTVYELRASANLYGFHFDYLDTISPESPTPSASTLSDADSVDNGDGFVVCHGTMYQFYSCRNNGCKAPREVYDRETESPWMNTRHLYLLHTKYSDFEGHWELLKPVHFSQFPVPLHRKIYGVIYPCSSLIYFDDHLGLDGFALQLEAQVNSDPLKVPPEDHDWPAHDGDNFAGCLSNFNNLITRTKRTTIAGNKLYRILSFKRMAMRFFQRNKVGDGYDAVD